MNLLQESILIAKKQNFTLSKTYIAHCRADEGLEGFSMKFIRKSVRGIGKYGVAGLPVASRVKIVLQEREVGFEEREKDSLEYLRVIMRNGQKEFTETSDQVFLRMQKSRPELEIHC